MLNPTSPLEGAPWGPEVAWPLCEQAPPSMHTPGTNGAQMCRRRRSVAEMLSPILQRCCFFQASGSLPGLAEVRCKDRAFNHRPLEEASRKRPLGALPARGTLQTGNGELKLLGCVECSLSLSPLLSQGSAFLVASPSCAWGFIFCAFRRFPFCALGVGDPAVVADRIWLHRVLVAISFAPQRHRKIHELFSPPGQLDSRGK